VCLYASVHVAADGVAGREFCGCVCVCMYAFVVCMYVSVDVCLYALLCACMHLCSRVNAHVCMYMYMYIPMYVYARGISYHIAWVSMKCLHMCICRHSYSQVHVCMRHIIPCCKSSARTCVSIHIHTPDRKHACSISYMSENQMLAHVHLQTYIHNVVYHTWVSIQHLHIDMHKHAWCISYLGANQTLEHVRLYTYIHLRLYTYKHVRLYTYKHVRLYTLNMCACIHTYTCA
jgi:hypothetical protein